jgi:hypothetical protein
MEAVEPWERQPGEPAVVFHAFCHYRNLPVGRRNLDRAWRDHQQTCKSLQPAVNKRAEARWFTWSAQWGFVARAEAHDGQIEKKRLEKVVEDQLEARARHARIMSTTLAALSVPTRILLEALQDPAVLTMIINKAKTDAVAFLQLEGLAARCAQVMPGLVQQERLALGLSSDSVEINDRREPDPLAARITKDPAATELAIRLLDQLAGTGEDASLGTGLLGEPGNVADGVTPEPADAEVS